jgi:AraC family transcriptional regulator, regulatory protein of adaptative response / methylated-DNA-[protein]-cysteine methyltransferase
MRQDDDGRWNAVLERQETADGLFYYAVRSTGIYCRPSCPSRRPKRENVTFFDSVEAAEEAGFRPCLRCSPQQISGWQRVVAQVEKLLRTAETPPSLAELADAVGLSPYHLQRLFKKATGLSPKQYAAALRAERLKAELKQGAASVTAALYEAGYGSPRALYEQAQVHLGMTPGAYRRGGDEQRIAYAFVDTAVGRMLVAATSKGVCAVRFGEDAAMLAELRAEFPRATLVEDAAATEPYVEAVAGCLAGRAPASGVPLDVRATAFQQKVWAALQSIPAGEVRSYSEVAAMIGAPSAVRAVAKACAANPIALVVPCHRVVRASGELSGYRWGVERKRALLSRERERQP